MKAHKCMYEVHGWDEIYESREFDFVDTYDRAWGTAHAIYDTASENTILAGSRYERRPISSSDHYKLMGLDW